MAELIRLDMPKLGGGRRWTVGTAVSSGCTRVSAALVSSVGRGYDCEVRVVGAICDEVPRETASLFASLVQKRTASVDAIITLRAELAEIEGALIGDLLGGLAVAPSRVLAVGADDPGLWNSGSGGPQGYLGLCDAARLADSTGLNVIDAFPVQDLAQGGQGGPLHALPQWILLRHPERSRVLLNLGQTVSMTYVPASLVTNPVSRILSFQAGPGTSLLNRLAQRLTGGQNHFDPGGRLAVQGRNIPELVDRWLDDPYFNRPLPRWHPRGVPPDRFLADALQVAVDSGWTVRDLLCSATHFVAEMVVRTFQHSLPKEARIDEIVVTGGGQQNGMLLREIAGNVEAPLCKLAELGLPQPALDPACAAVLALLHLDQVPGNQTAITRTDVPRLLGRLTPGCPRSWQLLLQASSGSNAVRSLRSAL